MAKRRILTFDSLDRVMPEIDQLLGGHTLGGHWTLGQICQHLATSLRLTVEGWPARAPWLVRRTIGAWYGRRLLARGVMPAGIKLKEAWGLRPGEGLDDRAEAEALRATLRYYSGVQDPFPEHPAFGPLSRPDWDRLHRIHCAHHLSFVWPGRVDLG